VQHADCIPKGGEGRKCISLRAREMMSLRVPPGHAAELNVVFDLKVGLEMVCDVVEGRHESRA
jgi:hypothetical protein